VRLTQAGTLLLPTIERVLAALAALGQEAVTVQQGADGLVRIAGISAATSAIAAQALPELCAARPHLAIDYREVDAAQIAGLCTSGAADVVLCRSATEVVSSFEFLPLRGDRVGVYCALDHPLARQHKLSAQDCATQQWLLPPDGSAPHLAFMDWCAQQQLAPQRVRLTTRSLPLSLELLKVMRCLYVGLESHMGALVRDHRLHQLPLGLPAEIDGLGLLCRREGRSPAVEEVVRHLLRSLGQPARA
jgi:DNA-binding transcriptional LysR family regulator